MNGISSSPLFKPCLLGVHQTMLRSTVFCWVRWLPQRNLIRGRICVRICWASLWKFWLMRKMLHPPVQLKSYHGITEGIHAPPKGNRSKEFVSQLFGLLTAVESNDLFASANTFNISTINLVLPNNNCKECKNEKHGSIDGSLWCITLIIATSCNINQIPFAHIDFLLKQLDHIANPITVGHLLVGHKNNPVQL